MLGMLAFTPSFVDRAAIGASVSKTGAVASDDVGSTLRNRDDEKQGNAKVATEDPLGGVFAAVILASLVSPSGTKLGDSLSQQSTVAAEHQTVVPQSEHNNYNNRHQKQSDNKPRCLILNQSPQHVTLDITKGVLQLSHGDSNELVVHGTLM